MADQQFKFDFSFLRTSIWITTVLAILEFAGVIDIGFWVFLPLVIAVALTFFVIFLIGLIVIFMISTGMVDDSKKTENDEETDSEA